MYHNRWCNDVMIIDIKYFEYSRVLTTIIIHGYRHILTHKRAHNVLYLYLYRYIIYLHFYSVIKVSANLVTYFYTVSTQLMHLIRHVCYMFEVNIDYFWSFSVLFSCLMLFILYLSLNHCIFSFCNNWISPARDQYSL